MGVAWPCPWNIELNSEVAAMRDGKHQELDRIRDVYGGYAGRATARWSITNAGNSAARAEYGRLTSVALVAASATPLASQELLEIGCGSGSILRLLLEHGAKEDLLWGLDLIHDRAVAAARSLPRAAVQTGNAEQLPYPSGYFDAVLMFGVLSSILDPRMQANIVREACRVTKPDGSIIVYDFRVPNPFNRATRPVSRTRIRRLFSSMEVIVRSMTVAPLLSRHLGKLTPRLYPILTSLPALHTHHLALIRRTAPAKAAELLRAGFIALRTAR
jgi:ubiquinone/menaquinone biosynthesis C-methylase UbiE